MFVCLLCFAATSLMYTNGWSLSKVRFSVQLYLFTCLFVYLFVCLFVYCVSPRPVSCTPTAGASPRSDLVYSCIYLLVCLFTGLFVYLFLVFVSRSSVSCTPTAGASPRSAVFIYLFVCLLVCLFIMVTTTPPPPPPPSHFFICPVHNGQMSLTASGHYIPPIITGCPCYNCHGRLFSFFSFFLFVFLSFFYSFFHFLLCYVLSYIL